MGFLNNLSNTFSRAFNHGKSAYSRFVGGLAAANRIFGRLDSKARAFGNLANVLTEGKLKTNSVKKIWMVMIKLKILMQRLVI